MPQEVPVGDYYPLKNAKNRIRRETDNSWKVDPEGETFDSLFEAYGSLFGYDMLLPAMVTHFAEDGMTLVDFYEENNAMTVEIIQCLWMMTYLKIYDSAAKDESYIDSILRAIDDLLAQLDIPEKRHLYRDVRAPLVEAQAQFQNVKRMPSDNWGNPSETPVAA